MLLMTGIESLIGQKGIRSIRKKDFVTLKSISKKALRYMSIVINMRL